MTAARRRGGAGDDGDGFGGATIRGALLIGAAVLVGVVLLGKGFDTGFLGSSGETPREQAGDDNGDDDDGTTTTPTTSTPTTHAPAEVLVQVLNSTGPDLSASATTDALAAAGYDTFDAGNADDQSATATAVYYAEGFQADAQLIAASLSITAQPEPMPSPPPPPAPAESSVVIVLGPDFTPPS